MFYVLSLFLKTKTVLGKDYFYYKDTSYCMPFYATYFSINSFNNNLSNFVWLILH